MSGTPPESAPWTDALKATMRLIESLGGRGMVIGGVAVSLTSTARYTKDVDALMVDDRITPEALLAAAVVEGLIPIPKDPQTFLRQHRVLPMVHPPSGFGVDVTLGALPFEVEAITRARSVEVAGMTIKVASPEDLIIMKAVAGRPQDWPDIRAIFEINPGLDQTRVMEWVRQYAEVLETPDLVGIVQNLLGPPTS